MSKQIRVSDEAYAVIEREAKRNHRSIIADQVDAMILSPISFDKPTVAERMANMKPEDIPVPWQPGQIVELTPDEMREHGGAIPPKKWQDQFEAEED